jgi:hypothetical protein
VAIGAVLDANVLYPIGLCDFFVTTAGMGLYRAHWSPMILDEVSRNLHTNRPDLGADRIAYRLDTMDAAMPGAGVSPPGSLVAAMTNHPKDRHVLAAAVYAEAQLVVTFNLEDFSVEACDPYGIEALHPDAFAGRLVETSPSTVLAAVEEMAGRRTRPPATVDQIIDHLAGHLPEAIGRLRTDRPRPGA